MLKLSCWRFYVSYYKWKHVISLRYRIQRRFKRRIYEEQTVAFRSRLFGRYAILVNVNSIPVIEWRTKTVGKLKVWTWFLDHKKHSGHWCKLKEEPLELRGNVGNSLTVSGWASKLLWFESTWNGVSLWMEDFLHTLN